MRHTRWIAIGVGAAGAVVVALALVIRRAPVSQRSELTPDPQIVHYRYTNSATTDSDLSSMIAQVEAIVKGPIATPLDMLDLAEMYQRRASQSGDVEDYKRAEQLARQSLEKMPTHNGAGVILAKVANAQHRFRDAIELAQKELARKPTATTHGILSTAYLALGQLAEAEAAADAAIKIAPNTSGFLMRALVRQARGKDVEAASDFARAVKVEEAGDPQGGARLRTLWGRFLLRRGDLIGARLVLDEALRIVPDYPLARAQRAELALRTGNTKEARAMFDQAFAASRQVRYLIDLARAQELAGDRAAADASRAQVERMVRAELADNGFGHQLDLVEILTDRGTPADLVEAIRLGREEIERRPSADTRFQLARALFRSGDREEARVQVQAALATGARDARLFELASRLETGARSEELAKEAVALDPGDSGWRKLGM